MPASPLGNTPPQATKRRRTKGDGDRDVGVDRDEHESLSEGEAVARGLAEERMNRTLSLPE
ncbi:unnamed protein product, partial [Ectocarpus sp. 12 AP-2014]